MQAPRTRMAEQRPHELAAVVDSTVRASKTGLGSIRSNL